MDNAQKISIGGKDLQFVLAIDSETGLHAWAAETDELWLAVTSNQLLQVIKDHPLQMKNPNTRNPKNFAASMNLAAFKSLLLTGEAERFRDYIMALCDIMYVQFNSNAPLMYVSFFSNSTNHFVNAMVEARHGIISFGAEMDI